VADLLLRLLYQTSYRLGFVPWASDRPDRGLVALVEGSHPLQPGRALDLGCGTGRNALYLARHGWQVTGVDMVERALEAARRTAERAGVAVRWIAGDVGRLDEMDLGQGYGLFVDFGCFHSLGPGRRAAYVAGVTHAAAPGARLVMVGAPHTPAPGTGITAAELRSRFSGWRLVEIERVPGSEMAGYLDGPQWLKSVVSRGRFPFEISRYWLEFPQGKRPQP
jgi:SAM-dependent methyltransferase